MAYQTLRTRWQDKATLNLRLRSFLQEKLLAVTQMNTLKKKVPRATWPDPDPFLLAA